MKNVRRIVLCFMAAAVLCLAACNTGDQSGSNQVNSLQGGIQQAKYTPLQSGYNGGDVNLNKQLGFVNLPGYFVYGFLSNNNTFNNYSISYYGSNDCTESFLNSITIPGATVPAGYYTFLDGFNYAICNAISIPNESGDNCTNEKNRVNSLKFTFNYVLPESGSTSMCLIGNPLNSIRPNSEFLANYKTGMQCSSTECKFSESAFMWIYTGFSITESYPDLTAGYGMIPQGGAFTVNVNLNSVLPHRYGVREQVISAVVINQLTGLPESSIVVNSDLSPCVLQSYTGNFNLSCQFTVSTKESTPASSYWIKFNNVGAMGAIRLSESRIPFVVAANGYFTITNNSNVESITISRTQSAFGNWYCPNSGMNPTSYVIAPGQSKQCTVTQANYQLNEAWNITGGDATANVSYYCGSLGSPGVCNESISNNQFLITSQPSGLFTSDSQSVIYASASCPSAAAMVTWTNANACKTDSVNFQGQTWSFNCTNPQTIAPIESFVGADVFVLSNRGVEVSCNYSVWGGGNTYNFITKDDSVFVAIPQSIGIPGIWDKTWAWAGKSGGSVIGCGDISESQSAVDPSLCQWVYSH